MAVSPAVMLTCISNQVGTTTLEVRGTSILFGLVTTWGDDLGQGFSHETTALGILVLFKWKV